MTLDALPRRALLTGGAVLAAGALAREAGAATDSDALHLLRRATHGPAPQDWLAVQALGTARWLDDQLLDRPDPACDAHVAVQFPDTLLTPAALQAKYAGKFADAGRQVAAVHLLRQVASTRQVYEQVVDVFFNRLNVPFTDDRAPWAYPSYYRDVIRQHSFGRYADMVAAMVRHPSMLIYLDGARSHKRNPNENLGRELLELHTVGVAAGYTERDVRDAARALTGLSIGGAAQEYTYQPTWHHTGPLRVLGWKSANADPKGEGVALSLVDYLTHHPACARHIARTLAVRFVSDSPSARLVEDLAKVYLASDTAIVPVLRALFAHKEFTASTGRKVRRPSQQAISFARVCGVRAEGVSASGATNMLWTLFSHGDALLNRPSPDGLPDVASFWLSSQSRLAALDTAGRTLDGWGNGLSRPDATSLRPGLPHETGGTPWHALTAVTATQVLDALGRRHLGQPLSSAQRAAVARAAGWDVRAPAAPLNAYDPGLPIAVALLAGHPRHTLR